MGSSILLSTGFKVPQIAYGTGTTWFKKSGDSNLSASLKVALNAGYRHIDCAEMYGTEADVGKAIKEFIAETGLQRDQLFVTSKVFNGMTDVKKAVQTSLTNLKLEYLDLYLIHSPFFKSSGIDADLKEVWGKLEELVREGLIRSIGVSNFRISDLEELLSFAQIKPTVNQVEFNPYLRQPLLHEFCKKHNIVIACYSPLASLTHKLGGPIDPVVQKLAAKYGKSSAQILLRWSIELGNIVVTTSTKHERISDFFNIFDFSLEAKEIDEINSHGEKLKFRKYWAKEFQMFGEQ